MPDISRSGGTLHYAFVDESGTADPFSGSHFLVVALLSTTRPRPLELHVKRAHKKHGTSLALGEIKASSSRAPVIERLLRAIAQEPVAIVSVIVDKRHIVRPPRDAEEIFREAVTRVLRHAVSRWPRLEVLLDRRYTNQTLCSRLERRIREGIADLHPQAVVIRQEDSIAHKALQAVDHVAWAFFQKYERGDDRFYQIIADKVVVEEIVEIVKW